MLFLQVQSQRASKPQLKWSHPVFQTEAYAYPLLPPSGRALHGLFCLTPTPKPNGTRFSRPSGANTSSCVTHAPHPSCLPVLLTAEDLWYLIIGPVILPQDLLFHLPLLLFPRQSSKILLCSYLHQDQNQAGHPGRQISATTTTPKHTGKCFGAAAATGPHCRCTVHAWYVVFLLTFYLFHLILPSSTQIKAG